MLYASKQILSGFSEFAMLIMLVVAIRHFDQCRSRWLAAFAVVLFLGISVAKLAMTYLAVDMADSAMALATEPARAALPLDRVAPGKREQYSISLARDAFRRSGQLQLVTDAAGQQWTYVPSQKEIKHREQWITTLAELEASRKTLWTGFLRGTGMLLAAFACSAAVVHEERKRRASAR